MSHLRKVSHSTRIAIPVTPEAKVGLSNARRSPTRGLKGVSRPHSRLRVLALFCAALGALYFLAGRGSSWKDTPAPAKPKKRRAGPPVIAKVERSVLESLRLLEIELNGGVEVDEEEARYRGGHAYDEGATMKRPPSVGYIPEVRMSKDGQLVPAHEIDRRVCGGHCAFVFPAWLGEQETKAQAHLYQLGLLALALNRTLVLPNVIRSRLGACYAKPFTYYYGQESLERLGVPTILQSELVAWAAVRDPPPTAQVISMLGAQAAHPEGAIAFDSESDPTLIPTKPDRKLCLTAPRVWLDWLSYSPITLYPPESWHKLETTRMAYGKRVVSTLLSPDIAMRVSRPPGEVIQPFPHVLAFNYELRYPILSPASLQQLMVDSQTPEEGFEHEADLYDIEANVRDIMSHVQDFQHFPYAPTWVQAATSVATSLSPFIAVHWRQETLPTSVLSTCAQQLIATLQEISTAFPDIRTVYLATDYPLHGTAHSGTFAKLVTEQHHEAMRKLMAGFPRQLRLTSYAQEAEEAAEGLDSGLLGIIDKSIAMQAEVFVTGFAGSYQCALCSPLFLVQVLSGMMHRYDPTMCSKESSFTRQIILAREEADGLRNVVSTFDVSGPRRPLLQ